MASDMKRASNVKRFFSPASLSGLPRVLPLVDNESDDIWRTMDSFSRSNESSESSSSPAGTGVYSSVCGTWAVDMVEGRCELCLDCCFLDVALGCFANMKLETKNSGKSR